MFEIFRKKRITKYTDRASEYLEQTFTPEAPPVMPKKESITRVKLDTDLGGSTPSSKDGVKYQKKKTPSSDSGVRYSLRSYDDDDVKYSERKTSDSSITLGDKYDSSAVASLMQKYNLSTTAPSFLKALDNTTNKTFVDTLIIHINKKACGTLKSIRPLKSTADSSQKLCLTDSISRLKILQLPSRSLYSSRSTRQMIFCLVPAIFFPIVTRKTSLLSTSSANGYISSMTSIRCSSIWARKLSEDKCRIKGDHYWLFQHYNCVINTERGLI